MDLFVDAALQHRDFAASEGVAPHLAQQLVRKLTSVDTTANDTKRNGVTAGNASTDTTSIRTTMSAPLHRFAVQTLQQHLRELQARHVEDRAMVVLDTATGDVLASVGSYGEHSSAADVDGVTALRQPGSTLKPFLYAQAIAEQRITAASLLDDASTQMQSW